MATGTDQKIYHSFGGADIHAVFGDTVFGELQMVSYKIDREKAPVYTMGSPDLRTIARGKRLITGACIFVVFDRDSLIQAMKDGSKNVWLSKDETANLTGQNASQAIQEGGTVSVLSGTKIGGTSTATQARTSLREKVAPVLLDQVLPFDITLYATSEYGAASKMTIHGVELMTEAGGVSINDVTLEKQISFIARRITPWTPEQ
jgi:hypothetical protein